MRVRCYKEGHGSDARDYDMDPRAAAERFCADDFDKVYLPSYPLICAIIVIPLDEEAKALPGWDSDNDDPAFKMIIVRAEVTIEWRAREACPLNQCPKGVVE